MDLTAYIMQGTCGRLDLVEIVIWTHSSGAYIIKYVRCISDVLEATYHMRLASYVDVYPMCAAKMFLMRCALQLTVSYRKELRLRRTDNRTHTNNVDLSADITK